MSRERRRRQRQTGLGTLHVVLLSVHHTDDELLDVMRQTRQHRRYDRGPVVCLLSDYDDDPRRLYEIPEVKVFCGHLVGLGFISFLDVSTTIPPLSSAPPVVDGIPVMAAYLGAFEIWSLSQGLTRGAGRYRVPLDTIARFQDVLLQANRRADDLLAGHPDPLAN